MIGPGRGRRLGLGYRLRPPNKISSVHCLFHIIQYIFTVLQLQKNYIILQTDNSTFNKELQVTTIYIYKQQCKIKNQLEDHWFASFRSFIDQARRKHFGTIGPKIQLGVWVQGRALVGAQGAKPPEAP